MIGMGRAWEGLQGTFLGDLSLMMFTVRADNSRGKEVCVPRGGGVCNVAPLRGDCRGVPTDITRGADRSAYSLSPQGFFA